MTLKRTRAGVILQCGFPISPAITPFNPSLSRHHSSNFISTFAPRSFLYSRENLGEQRPTRETLPPLKVYTNRLQFGTLKPPHLSPPDFPKLPPRPKKLEKLIGIILPTVPPPEQGERLTQRQPQHHQRLRIGEVGRPQPTRPLATSLDV